MHDLMLVVIEVVPVLVAFYLFALNLAWVLMKSQSESVVFVADNDDEDELRDMASAVVSREWLIDNGFRYEGCFWLKTMFGTPGFIVWKNSAGPTKIIVSKFNGGITPVEFMTWYSDTHALTTSSVSLEMLLPQRKGSWSQAYPKHSVNQMWALHLQADEVLTKRMDYTHTDHIEPLSHEIVGMMRSQANDIRSMRFWRHRFIGWCFTRVYRLRLKSVAEQIRYQEEKESSAKM